MLCEYVQYFPALEAQPFYCHYIRTEDPANATLEAPGTSQHLVDKRWFRGPNEVYL